jgi:hypothetical protein
VVAFTARAVSPLAERVRALGLARPAVLLAGLAG